MFLPRHIFWPLGGPLRAELADQLAENSRDFFLRELRECEFYFGKTTRGPTQSGSSDPSPKDMTPG